MFLPGESMAISIYDELIVDRSAHIACVLNMACAFNQFQIQMHKLKTVVACAARP